MSRPLKLPRSAARKRIENKALWNEARSIERADFYTIGYEGRTADQLIEILQDADVRSILDIRFTPLSRFRPEMSKSNLKERVEAAGMYYYHAPHWGVPKDIRAKSIDTGSRDVIWDWYETYIIGQHFEQNLHWFLNIEHPAALLCVEFDPTECHRHRIFLALERQGLCGFDL